MAFWENLDAGDAFDGLIDLGKTVLPVALDKPGGRGLNQHTADKSEPVDTSGEPISGANGKSLLSSTPVLIGGAVVAVLIIFVVLRSK